MNRRFRRHRFLLFSGLAAGLGVALCALFFWHVSVRFQVGDWTDFLGPNERASLERAALGAAPDPDLTPVGDPMLTIPGMRLVLGESMRNPRADQTLFFASPLPEAERLDQLAIVGAWWRQLGREVAFVDGEVRAKAVNGRFYQARRDVTDPKQVVVMRTARSGSLLARQRAQWPPAMQGVFPPVPAAADTVELGLPGRPGYSVMVGLVAPAGNAYRLLDADLLRRGWEPLPTSPDPGLRPNAAEIYARTYRHKTHPLGCQLLIQRDPETLGASRALYSLL
jgi:hypothetical protein